MELFLFHKVKYDLDKIKSPVATELELFEQTFKSSFKSSVPLLDKILYYIVKRKGKQIRPLVVFLTAKLHNGQRNDSTFVAASLIELLHTATLVHDDVVDDAQFRRGMFSINALWKNKIAVLVGDFLLSKGLLTAIEKKEFQLLEIVSNAVKKMSEGELLQIEKARKLDITEEVYFDIISKKTASLLSSCTACGAQTGGANEHQLKNMELFGEYIGIAFQLKDDLFDYGLGINTGKPTGIDIKEKKMTLPLIYTLQKVDSKNKKWLINTVKHHNTDTKRVQQSIELITQTGGIDYAVTKMHDYRDKALKLLTDNYPDNEVRSSLIDLVNYTIEREK